MLNFDSVKLRLEREQSLSYMEFNYMMLQAYDFYELNKRQKCILQIGGSDQWGNIVNGTDLIKRKKTYLWFNNSVTNTFFWCKNGKNRKRCYLVK